MSVMPHKITTYKRGKILNDRLSAGKTKYMKSVYFN
jgi:hypothetical protein